MSIETNYKVTISVTAEESQLLNIIFDSIQNDIPLERNDQTIALVKMLRKAFPFFVR